MAYETDFRGGRSDVGYTPYTDSDNQFVYDTISYPGGNAARDGGNPVAINYVTPTGASGVTAATVSSDGYARVYCGTARLTFKRNPGAGGTIQQSPTPYSWAGGLVGYFGWSTVPTIIGSIAATRTVRDVMVAITGSGSDGGSGITSYQVERAWSADGVTGWSAWEDTQTVAAGSYNYAALTPGRYYKFRSWANNGNGAGQARVTSALFVPAGGKRKVSGSFQNTTIARRRAAGAWIDLSTAKRKASGAFVDLS